MLKGKVNALNVFKVRKVDFCPPYFETTTFPTRYNLSDSIDDWINTHCNGTYYIGKTVSLSDKLPGSSMVQGVKVGFENSSELSYFLLACPHLKYN